MYTSVCVFKPKAEISKTPPKTISQSKTFKSPIFAVLLTVCLCAFTLQPALALAPEPPPDSKSADLHLAETLTCSFQRRFEGVIGELKSYLNKTRPRYFFWQAKQAVILDLDETLLDNRAYYVQYKTFNPNDWHRWVILAEAPGIPQSVALVSWLQQKHFKVYFISGRLESERAVTVENLNKIGIQPERDYDGLYLRPDNYDKASMANFKLKAQQELEAKGYKVVAFLGDQASDMKSAIGKGFKLPNPIYTVP